MRKSIMESSADVRPTGLFEPRYVAFIETVAHLRPNLHRYCARMAGSVLDGEDIVQDALFQAYCRLDTFDDRRPLAPWLFRIAHNRCIDFIRRRASRADAEAAAAGPASVPPLEPAGAALGRAVEHLVLTLPPKERACVLLKDVFDYSLEEIAELVGSTVGAVKAALSRGRTKLAAMPPPAARRQPASAERARLLHLYVERFNRRDWDGVRELIAADARIDVADRVTGPMPDSPYFGRYERWTVPWRMAVAEVDGEPAVIVLQPVGGAWAPKAIVRLDIGGGVITRVADYTHCPWVLSAASTVAVEAEPT